MRLSLRWAERSKRAHEGIPTGIAINPPCRFPHPTLSRMEPPLSNSLPQAGERTNVKGNPQFSGEGQTNRFASFTLMRCSHVAGRHVREPARRVAARTVNIGFDGYAIAATVRRRAQGRMLRISRTPRRNCRRTSRRYLMGWHAGRIVAAVGAGHHMFDCVMRRQCANGMMFTPPRRHQDQECAISPRYAPLGRRCQFNTCRTSAAPTCNHLPRARRDPRRALNTIHNLLIPAVDGRNPRRHRGGCF